MRRKVLLSADFYAECCDSLGLIIGWVCEILEF